MKRKNYYWQMLDNFEATEPRIRGHYFCSWTGGKPSKKTTPTISLELDNRYKCFVLKTVGLRRTFLRGYIPVGEVMTRTPTIYLVREIFARLRSKKHLQNMKVFLDLLIENQKTPSSLTRFLSLLICSWENNEE